MTSVHKAEQAKYPNLPEGANLEHPAKVLGLLSCAPDEDYRGLLQTLSGSLPAPVVGGTSLANPFETGADPFTTNLAFLGRKNIRHSISLSPPLVDRSGPQLMASMYNDCLQKLGEEPKLFFVFAPILPNLYLDDFANELFRLAGDVPVFGGMVSDGPEADLQAVFADGYYHRDRMLLVGLAGDIQPVFGVDCRVTTVSDHTPVVTAATGNMVRRVNNMRFIDYLRKIGLDAESLDEFPLSVRRRNPDTPPDAIPMVDALVRIDHESGAGILSSDVPEGSTLGIVILTRDNIVQSTNSAIDKLLAGMDAAAKSGYQFEMVFAVSCIARYYMMSAGEHIEAEILAERLPRELSKFGFFGFREVCPITAGGKCENRIWGQTLTLCAF